MPKEYIEREALIEDIKNDCLEQVYYTKEDAIWCVKAAPTADVVKVVHGEWEEYQTPNIICCSVCDWGTSVDEKSFKYCPNCGAKMDGERRIK